MLASTSVSSKIILFFVKKKKEFLKYISNNIYIIQMFFFLREKTLFENLPFILEQRKGKKVRTCFKLKKKVRLLPFTKTLNK